jgi:Bacterial Ig domain
MNVFAKSSIAAIILAAICALGWNEPAKAGTLTGSFTIISSNAVVDLTQQGPLDWVHWGKDTEYGYNRKATSNPLIGTLTPIIAGGGEGPYQYGDNFNGYSWSDGVPSVFATNTITGIYTIGKSCGFQLTVPADTTVRKLKVYVGAFDAQGQLTATLSDNSASAYSDSSINNLSNGPSGFYTLDYAANSTGQTLTVKYIVEKILDNKQPGNVTWQAAALSYANSNNPPTATIITPTNNATYSAPASVLIQAVASDSDGSIAKLEFYQGETKLGEKTNGDFSFVWTNAPPGDYLLRVKATDNGGLTYTSAPVEMFVNSAGGILTGNLSVVPSTVDLTAEGILDWAHWGLSSSNSFDHKAGVIQRIPKLNKLGSNVLQQLTDFPTAFSWSDGTPTFSEPGTTTGIFVTGYTNGFEWVIPVSTNLQTVKLYMGGYGGQAGLQAFLSDSSAPAYTDISLKSFYGNFYGVYTLSFAAASPNQTLRLRLTAQALYDAVYGNVAISAAALSTIVPPQAVMLENPSMSNGAFSFSFSTQTNRNYSVIYTDSLNPVAWQVLTNFIGDGETVIVTDVPTASSARYYGVLIQ